MITDITVTITTLMDQKDRVARNTVSTASLIGKRVGLSGCLVLATWACVLSATDRAGWAIPLNWWGTSPPLEAYARSLNQGDSNRTIAAAEILVYRDPVGRSSASALAQALGMAGEAHRSAEAFQIALASGWRNTEAQIWAIEAALVNQSLQQAAAHLDALLRITGDAAPQATWLTAIEKSPAGRAALADRLSQTPPWTGRWLRSSADLPKDRISDRIGTLQMARSRGLVVTASDAASASWRLIDNHPEHALTFWHAIKGRGDSATRGIWDADFRRSFPELRGGPFEWRRIDSTGAQMKAADSPKGSGLEISNLSIATSTLMETLTSLRPGTWRLTWQQAGSPGVRIVPSCLKRGKMASPTVLRSFTGKALRFSVTASCPIQKISIVSSGDPNSSSRGTIFNISVDLESS